MKSFAILLGTCLGVMIFPSTLKAEEKPKSSVASRLEKHLLAAESSRADLSGTLPGVWFTESWRRYLLVNSQNKAVYTGNWYSFYIKVDKSSRILVSNDQMEWQYFGTLRDGLLIEDQGDYGNFHKKKLNADDAATDSLFTSFHPDNFIAQLEMLRALPSQTSTSLAGVWLLNGRDSLFVIDPSGYAVRFITHDRLLLRKNGDDTISSKSLDQVIGVPEWKPFGRMVNSALVTNHYSSKDYTFTKKELKEATSLSRPIPERGR